MTCQEPVSIPAGDASEAGAACDREPHAGGPTLLFVVNVAWFFLSHRLPLARSAIAAGLRVHLASDVEDESEILEVRREGIQFHRLRIARSGLNPLHELRSIQELRRVVQYVRPDLVHHVTPKPVVYGSWIARALGTRGVVNAISGFGHAYGPGARRTLLRALLDRAYARAFAPQNVRVIVQNDADRAEVVRICPQARPRIRLIQGSGVDLAVFRACSEPEGIPIVLLAARMLREKGIYEFAAAAAELRRSGVSARYLLAGRPDPANRSGLSIEQVRDLCDGAGVAWVGDCKDMAALFRECHIVCLPSYYREGVPKVLLEACACARPIVTTDIPGCRDVVHHGQNGLLVPPRDSQALAAALHRLIADPVRRKQMGLQARIRAEREFGVQQVVEKHLELYQELLASPWVTS